MKIFGFIIGLSPQRKLENELQEYYTIAEDNPEDVRIHLRIAEILMKVDRKYKAIEEYIYAAEAYEANNLSQIAAAIYKQVLQIDPDQVNVYQTLVNIHQKEGFLGDAIATYERLAGYYYSRGMKEDAIGTLEKMVKLDPDSLYVKNKIDKFYAGKDLDTDSDKTPISGEGGEIFDPLTSGKKKHELPLNQEKEGFFDLEAALQDEFLTEEDKPKDTEGLGDIADRSALGFDEIFKEIQKTNLKTDAQDDLLFHYNLGNAFQRVGRIDEAIEELKKALGDHKRNPDCYLRLALCNRDKDQIDDAIKYLKKGLRTKDISEQKQVELLYEMAMMYKKKEKKKKALKILRQVHGMSSNFRDIRQELDELS